ncbi:MAG: replication factor C large subunit [Methanomassiliicoccaceae archaeon]|jgi:replication factor C large subunit|nr:replication factor C large subunit [Methanomassiliicoccaceae archaeon]
MSQDWTEKYRPDSLSKVIGNPKAVTELTDWAKSWNRGVPTKRAVILTGSPGIGKTSAAIALAKDMKWDVIEMNASDHRNGDAIKSIALKGAKLNTFMEDGKYVSTKEGGRKLIILDEADNLFGREDKGAVPAISELIKSTMQPVVLIVNDLYALTKKSNTVKTETIQITFMRPRVTEIVKALDRIAKAENITADPEALRKMAENSNGDMRAAVRNLESLALGRNAITNDDAGELSDRIVRKDIYDLMNAIFREKDPMKARRMQMDTDETPDHIMMWIDENMPFEFRDRGDLMRGYDRLARADVFMGRVGRRQYFRFWAYAGDMMSAGVNISRRSERPSYERFRFPMYLMKMSRSKETRKIKNNVCTKLAAVIHTSTARISNDVLPSLKIMLRNDPELARSLVILADLEAEEVAFLLDAKEDSKAVRDIMPADPKNIPEPETRSEAKPARKTAAAKKEPQPETAKKEDPKKEPQPGSQKSLFQF